MPTIVGALPHEELPLVGGNVLSLPRAKARGFPHVLVIRLALLALCLCTGCTGALVDALEQRQVASCIWWNSTLTGARSISATGGVDIRECLAVPCMLAR